MQSLTEINSRYEPIQVEVSLIPGLPQIHFLGRADSSLKESAFRLKSAFRQSGFKFPKAHQVIVNLTPSHFKKVSAGIELAVAVALLKMTDQGPSWDPAQYIIFGELSLGGEISFPQVSKFFNVDRNKPILSGKGMESFIEGYQAQDLRGLSHPEFVDKTRRWQLEQPPSPVVKLTPRQAEALLITAVGGHHVLLAGAQGSGKTLMCEVLAHVIDKPEPELLEWHEAVFGQPLKWRPVARPHHTITPQSMVGGGVPPRPGEITRAHGGILFLDEMMEFRPATLEVLREALSAQKVTVSRGLKSVEFPSSFQLIGATNLCPCGKWTPGKSRDCDYSDKRCRSVVQKLSGPLLDRIHGFFYFDQRMEKPQVSVEEVSKRLVGAKSFQREQGRSHNRDFNESSLNPAEALIWRKLLESFEIPSVRRRQACVAWARTLADLEAQPQVAKAHFLKAYEQTVKSYEALF